MKWVWVARVKNKNDGFFGFDPDVSHNLLGPRDKGEREEGKWRVFLLEAG